MNSTTILAIALLPLHTSNAAQHHVLAIPGKGAFKPQGSSKHYVSQQLGIAWENIHTVKQPIFGDLGQRFCQKYLIKSYDAHCTKAKGYFLHASSQGTATALNFLASHPGSQDGLKGMICESPMATGNSAIAHFCRCGFSGQLWFPYVARFFGLWTYSPSGMQGIKSASNIWIKDFPIIIVHSIYDDQLPYYGACALYYALKKAGHKHVYFITKDGDDHMELLDGSLEDRAIVKSILARHGVVKVDGEAFVHDVSLYQPDHLQYQAVYEKLLSIEKAHTVIGAMLATVCTVYILYYLMLLSLRYV